MSRSRFAFCLAGAGLCATSAFAGLAYAAGPGAGERALVGGGFVGGCCLASVLVVRAVGWLARPRAVGV